MSQLYAGTSGFAYDTWKPEFYPAKMPSRKYLSFYAARLNTTEINYTYHRLPSGRTLEGWVAGTPETFVFALKAHQKITHILRLNNAGDFTETFLKVVDPLRTSGRMGPVLFQLPPNLKCDAGLLREFVSLLPTDVRCAFEFRHDSWLTDEIYAILGDRKIALCLAESEKLVIPPVLTSDFVYARLRKPDYSEGDLKEIESRVAGQLETGLDVYLYFKHEDTPEGAFHAEQLLKWRSAQ